MKTFRHVKTIALFSSTVSAFGFVALADPAPAPAADDSLSQPVATVALQSAVAKAADVKPTVEAKLSLSYAALKKLDADARILCSPLDASSEATPTCSIVSASEMRGQKAQVQKARTQVQQVTQTAHDTAADLAAKVKAAPTATAQVRQAASDAKPAAGKPADKPAEKPTDAAVLKNLDTKLAAMQLMDDFKTLEVDGLSIEQKLDKLDAKLDSSILAAYFQDKIGLLLNSQVFCTAVNERCKTSNSVHVPIGPDKLKQVFPNIDATSNSRSGQQYWDKEHPSTGQSK